MANWRFTEGFPFPICSYCKSVRDDGNYWSQIEVYLKEHSDLQLSHGVCDSCYGHQMESLAAEVAKIKAQSDPRPGLTVRLDN